MARFMLLRIHKKLDGYNLPWAKVMVCKKDLLRRVLDGFKLNNLLERFKTKGYMAIELPGLVKDVLNIVSTGGYSTITSIAQELEDL